MNLDLCLSGYIFYFINYVLYIQIFSIYILIMYRKEQVDSIKIEKRIRHIYKKNSKRKLEGILFLEKMNDMLTVKK